MKGVSEQQVSALRPMRADARRSLDALIEAAKAVFAEVGVDAPVRDVAARAGLGVGTVYRHFSHRADLIAAVFRHEIDETTQAAVELAETEQPFDALRLWMQRFSAFFATKRGLGTALHSGEPAYASLPDLFEANLRPALEDLLGAAIRAGAIRSDIAPGELLGAIARLSMTDVDEPAAAQRMVALLADGLRGARTEG